MSVYVFLGPTLPVAKARVILDATYLPPVACGDVQRLVSRRPTAIGIVDGYFAQKPAVFHKEILYALSRGVRVFGASSMGALRAAELHTFGMEGIGRVFEAYRDGEIEDDDEVAVVHGARDTGFAPYSDAMVNLRDGLRQAVAAGAISAETHDALVAIAKGAFYAERSWRHLVHAGRQAGLPVAELEAFVARERPNRKRDDALEMLRHMANELVVTRPAQPDFRFAATVWWQRLKTHADHATRYGVVASGEIPAKAFTLHARLYGDPDRTLLRDATVLNLVAEVAQLRGLDASDAEVAEQLRAMGASADEPTAEALATLEVLTRKLGAVAVPSRLASQVPLALLQRGRLASTIDEVRRKWQWLHARGQSRPTFESAAIGPEELFAWYRAATGAPEESVAALCASLGLEEEEFYEEALRQYLIEKAYPRCA